MRLTSTVAVVRGRFWMRMLLCLSMLGSLTLPASAKDEVAPRPLAIKGEVRYHFREELEGVAPGEKKYSAPAYEKEAVVNGRVAHLPYRFVIQVDGQGALEVNVLDSEGKALQGYPRKIENPFAGESASQEFEIPVAPELAHRIETEVLAKNQHLTEVQLVVKPSSSEGGCKRSTGRQAIGHEPSGGHLGRNTRVTALTHLAVPKAIAYSLFLPALCAGRKIPRTPGKLPLSFYD